MHTLYLKKANKVLFIHVGQPDLNVDGNKKTITLIFLTCENGCKTIKLQFKENRRRKKRLKNSATGNCSTRWETIALVF